LGESLSPTHGITLEGSPTKSHQEALRESRESWRDDGRCRRLGMSGGNPPEYCNSLLQNDRMIRMTPTWTIWTTLYVPFYCVTFSLNLERFRLAMRWWIAKTPHRNLKLPCAFLWSLFVWSLSWTFMDSVPGPMAWCVCTQHDDFCGLFDIRTWHWYALIGLPGMLQVSQHVQIIWRLQLHSNPDSARLLRRSGRQSKNGFLPSWFRWFRWWLSSQRWRKSFP